MDRDHNTALHLAVHASPLPAAAFLLQLANVYPAASRHKNAAGQLPLHAAIHARRRRRVPSAGAAPAGDGKAGGDCDWQQQEAGRLQRDNLAAAAAAAAAAASEVEVVHTLLEIWPAAARTRDREGRLPLHLAAAGADLQVPPPPRCCCGRRRAAAVAAAALLLLLWPPPCCCYGGH